VQAASGLIPASASNAPLGFFTGSRFGRDIALSAAPQVIDGRLTITPNTTVGVQLQLQQQPVNDADPASEFGKDARAAEIELPEEFAFHFAGGNHAIDTLGHAVWRTYGHEAAFDWRQQQLTTYDPVLNRVLIPVTASTERFEVTDNQSPFHTLSGETKIVASFGLCPQPRWAWRIHRLRRASVRWLFAATRD
jgi:hypothetical protein